jgi:hypothetical protein
LIPTLIYILYGCYIRIFQSRHKDSNRDRLFFAYPWRPPSAINGSWVARIPLSPVQVPEKAIGRTGIGKKWPIAHAHAAFAKESEMESGNDSGND